MPDQASDSSREHLYKDQGELSISAETSMAARYVDPDRRLDTLVAALGEELAEDFFWKAETGTIQTYEHRFSYRYVHIDCVTGQFCDQQRAPISLERALAHAMPRVQSSPSRWALAPVILELNLAPFVRAIPGNGDDGQVPAPAEPRSASPGWLTGVVSRGYQRLQLRLQKIGKFAGGAAAPMGENDDPAHGHLQGSDLSLASFTRRAA